MVATIATAQRHWPFLDLLRGGAALLVMVGHARGFFLPPFNELAETGIVTSLLYLITGLQHEAVVLFFVVSGYLVGGRLWVKISEGQFELSRYLIDRFSRIYVVLVPAIILTLLVTVLLESPLTGRLPETIRPSPAYTWDMLPCHLASMQSIYCSVLPDNPPLWSLGYEWMLYLAVPLGFAITLAPLGWPIRLIGLGIWISLLWVVLPDHFLWQWAIFWLLGAAAVAVPHFSARTLPLWIGLIAMAVALTSLLISRLSIFPVAATDFLIALSLAVSISNKRLRNLSMFPRLEQGIAACSFSLYAIHYPLLLLFVALLGNWANGMVALLGVTLLVLGAAYGFSVLTEARTGNVRRYVHSWAAR